MYPHMGQVITEYRVRRGFQTQKALAIALQRSSQRLSERPSGDSGTKGLRYFAYPLANPEPEAPP